MRSEYDDACSIGGRNVIILMVEVLCIVDLSTYLVAQIADEDRYRSRVCRIGHQHLLPDFRPTKMGMHSKLKTGVVCHLLAIPIRHKPNVPSMFPFWVGRRK